MRDDAHCGLAIFVVFFRSFEKRCGITIILVEAKRRMKLQFSMEHDWSERTGNFRGVHVFSLLTVANISPPAQVYLVGADAYRWIGRIRSAAIFLHLSSEIFSHVTRKDSWQQRKPDRQTFRCLPAQQQRRTRSSWEIWWRQLWKKREFWGKSRPS